MFWRNTQLITVLATHSSSPDMENENVMDMYLVLVSNSAECCAIVEAHKTLCNTSCNK